MKVQSTKVDPEYTPVSITITLETPTEAGAFYALCNHVDICDLMSESNISLYKIRRAIEVANSVRPAYYDVFDKLKVLLA